MEFIGPPVFKYNVFQGRELLRILRPTKRQKNSTFATRIDKQAARLFGRLINKTKPYLYTKLSIIYYANFRLIYFKNLPKTEKLGKIVFRHFYPHSVENGQNIINLCIKFTRFHMPAFSKSAKWEELSNPEASNDELHHPIKPTNTREGPPTLFRLMNSQINSNQSNMIPHSIKASLAWPSQKSKYEAIGVSHLSKDLRLKTFVYDRPQCPYWILVNLSVNSWPKLRPHHRDVVISSIHHRMSTILEE
ncbi:unnamed protein product [Nesidiocoris tenuis]|uniref:Uncharacterized protein n=1 Tax=Nesidiocoris tenuis TaxID=355587 RepID=A0A6H5GSS9_9HEMI|nr:unnamed protein product [Nesidiocoris tenuis]